MVSSVNAVRTLRRPRLRKTRWKYFIAPSPQARARARECCSSSDPLLRWSVRLARAAASGSWVTITMVLPCSSFRSAAARGSRRRSCGRGRRWARRRG
jgi:hypothetical protein